MTTMRDMLSEMTSQYVKITNGISAYQTVWLVSVLDDAIIIADREESTEHTVVSLRAVQAFIVER